MYDFKKKDYHQMLVFFLTFPDLFPQFPYYSLISLKSVIMTVLKQKLYPLLLDLKCRMNFLEIIEILWLTEMVLNP